MISDVGWQSVNQGMTARMDDTPDTLPPIPSAEYLNDLSDRATPDPIVEHKVWRRLAWGALLLGIASLIAVGTLSWGKFLDTGTIGDLQQESACRSQLAVEVSKAQQVYEVAQGDMNKAGALISQANSALVTSLARQEFDQFPKLTASIDAANTNLAVKIVAWDVATQAYIVAQSRRDHTQEICTGTPAPSIPKGTS